MPMPSNVCPEVVGQVRAEMFDEVQAVQKEHLAARDFGFGRLALLEGLSDRGYELLRALDPLLQLIMEREKRQVTELDVTAQFGALQSQRRFDTDFWHRDGNRFSRVANYAVARGLGTEFLVSAKSARKLSHTPSANKTQPNLQIVEERGRLCVVQPGTLTVVRFIKQRHRAPIDPEQTNDSRPWIRASVDSFF